MTICIVGSGGNVGGTRARHDAPVPGRSASLHDAAARGRRASSLRAHYRAHSQTALSHRDILAGGVAAAFSVSTFLKTKKKGLEIKFIYFSNHDS